ncbi:MAG: membrane-bound lytic murein transglycosylase D [Sphingobacteriales bacterium]|jgi:membrane-bound lytic murein transglycosylase D
MRITFLLIVSLFIVQSLALANNDTTKKKIPVITQDSLDIDSLFEEIDSLAMEMGVDTVGFDFELPEYDSALSNIDYPDSIYEARLKLIQKDIPLDFNRYVKSYIAVYTKKRREQVGKMLSLQEYYFPMVDSIFTEQGIPLEMRYLSIVESALNPIAVSRMGATGMWQFMYYTGLQYKLKIDTYTDDRRNPEKATLAASQYFNNMYAKYGDWLLVIAAYNCGPGNVNKAIRRSGGKRNFWEIMRYLPRETRGYVPAFVAATYAMNFSGLHNIYPLPLDFDFDTDTVLVNRPMTFDQLASVTDLTFDDIRFYNPSFRKYLIPESAREKAFEIKLPRSKKESFLNVRDSMYTILDSIQAENPLFIAEYRPKELTDLPVRVYYKIKSGDNLGYIADWFDVTPSQLRRWNNIRGNNIRAGKRLYVYIPEHKAEKYREITHMTFAQKQRKEGKSVSRPATKVAPATVKSNNLDPTFNYHKVESGESLWTIARKYGAISADDLKAMNNITDHRRIQPGMYIKVGKKG